MKNGLIKDIYAMTDKQNVISLNKRLIKNITAKINRIIISRKRKVNITVKDLVNLKEGLWLFCYDPDTETYVPTILSNSSLAAARLKGYIASNTTDTKSVKTATLDPIMDLESEEFRELARKLFGISNIEEYRFILKASTDKVTNVRRNIETPLSKMVEAGILLPPPLVSMNEDELLEYKARDRFLAYVFVTMEDIEDDKLVAKGLVISDLGVLLDNNSIDVPTICDLMNSSGRTTHADVHSFTLPEAKRGPKLQVNDSTAKRIKWLAEHSNKDVKIIPGVYTPPNKPWSEFSDEEAIDFIKDRAFVDFKILEDGTLAAIRNTFTGFSMYVGVTAHTDFLRTPSWHYKTLNDAVKDMELMTCETSVPRNGTKVIIPLPKVKD